MHTITKSIAIFITTALVINAMALVLNAMAPALAHAAKHLQGDQVNANALVRDAYIAVTYRDGNDKQKSAKGWIDAIGETSFTIRRGGLKSKTTVAYAKVLSIIMSEASSVPATQMNEVNRFIRNMKAREIEQAKEEASEAMAPALAQATADSQSTKVNQTPIQRIKTPNARVRVQAPVISKKRIIGRIVRMTQDTLVIEGPGWIFMPGRRTPVEKGRTLYRLPLSAITNTEVSLGQRRNTYKGLAIGLGLGLAVLVAAIPAPLDEDELGLGAGAVFGVVAVVIVPSIVVLATLMGAATKSEKWVEVPPQRLNLSIAPTLDKGFRAALTVNF